MPKSKKADKPNRDLIAVSKPDTKPDTKPAKPVADPEYKARHEASRGRVAALYAGLSHTTTLAGKARPFALYAESAKSGNGHSPNSYTERDQTAVLEAGILTGFKAGVPYNPGIIGGDKSAHGIRIHGHGYAVFSKSGDTFELTESGAKQALSEKARAEKAGVTTK